MHEKIIVLKFGSSVLRSHADLPSIVHEIYRWYRDGARVIAVVSAIGDATEQLIRQSRELCAHPEPWATAGPGARLRLYPGKDNITVGPHVPPKSGEHIAAQLQALLSDINAEKIDPWSAHVQFETLHPFSDGNGRCGRICWYFSMRNTSRVDLGFLHGFFLQTLNKHGSTHAKTLLIHPDLARSAQVEWPDVDLDRSSIRPYSHFELAMQAFRRTLKKFRNALRALAK
jgi:hypothetical protein